MRRIIIVTLMLVLFSSITYAAECNQTITNCCDISPSNTNSTFTLSQNLSNVSQNCFYITKSDIIFDCSGYEIKNPNSIKYNAIDVSNNINITIKNCKITHFWKDIKFTNVNNSQIINNTFFNHSWSDGQDIGLVQSHNNRVINNTLNNSFVSIVIANSDYNNLSYNSYINSSSTTIIIWGSRYNLFYSELYKDNNNSIKLDIYSSIPSSNNTFSNITISSSVANHTGINLVQAYNNTFEGINVTGTGAGSVGVRFENATGNEFYDSYLENNGNDTVYMISPVRGFSNNTYINVSLTTNKILFDNESQINSYFNSSLYLHYSVELNFSGYNLGVVDYSLAGAADSFSDNASAGVVVNHTYLYAVFSGNSPTGVYSNNFTLDANATNFTNYFNDTISLDKNDFLDITMLLLDSHECGNTSSYCNSTYCKEDYDAVGSWCAQSTQCTHDAALYNNSDYAPDCYDINDRRVCNSGTWTSSNSCGNYQCYTGNCYSSCTNTTTYCQSSYFCINDSGSGVCDVCSSYNNQQCSVSSNSFLSDGFCARNYTSSWTCDNSYLALFGSDYYQQCYNTIQGASCNNSNIFGLYSAMGICVFGESCNTGLTSSNQSGGYFAGCENSTTSLIQTCENNNVGGTFNQDGICAYNQTDTECVDNGSVYNVSEVLYTGCSNGGGESCEDGLTGLETIFTPDGICTFNNVCTQTGNNVSRNNSIHYLGCQSDGYECDSNLSSYFFERDGYCYQSECLLDDSLNVNQGCFNDIQCGDNLTCENNTNTCKGIAGFTTCFQNSDCSAGNKCFAGTCAPNEAPIITLISMPNQTTIYNTGTANITFNISDETDPVFNCSITVTDQFGPFTNNLTGITNNTIYNFTFTGLAQSLMYYQHNYTINCTDDLNWSIKKATFYINDTISPTIEIIPPSPNDSDYNNSFNYNLTINITFNDTNPYNYSIYVDSVEVKSGSNDPYSNVSVPLNGYGAHTWFANITDDFGNLNATTPRTFYKINIIPNVTQINITSSDNDNYTNATFTAAWNGSDYYNDTTINETKWYRNGQEYNFSSGSYYVNWTITFSTGNTQAPLDIFAVLGATYGNSSPDDLQPLSLRCGAAEETFSWNGSAANDSDWYCPGENGYWTVRVLTSGTHFQNLTFVSSSALANKTVYYNATNTLQDLFTAKNDSWIFSVRVYDGYNWSYWANSSAITINNAPPSKPNITYPQNSTVYPYEDINITCSGSSDEDFDSLTYRIYTNKTGIWTFEDNNTATLNTTNGTTYYTKCNAFDGENSSQNSSIISFYINDPPKTENLTLTSDQPLENSTDANFTASWDYTDDLNSSITINETRWYNGTTLVSALNNKTILNKTYTNKNDVWKFSVRVYDGYDFSEWQNSSAVVIQNNPPTKPNITFPINNTIYAYENINITCSGSTDPDNDSINYLLFTNKTGIWTFEDNNTATLITANGTWYAAKCIANDGFKNSTDSSIIRFYINDPPRVNVITITSNDDQNYTNATFTATWETWFDTTNATNNITLNETKWYNGGTLITSLNNKTTLNKSFTSKNENWTFYVHVKDEYNWSDWKNSTLIINNAPPTLSTNPSIDNSTPKTNDILTCINGTYQDLLDSDLQIGNEWKWYNNSVLIGGETNTTLNLSILGLNKQDNITCSQRTSDGEDWSAWYNSTQITIQNTLPNYTYQNITPTTPYTNSTLQVNITVGDDDNDTISVWVDWFVNFVKVFSQFFSGLASGDTITSFLSFGNFSKHDNITAQITVGDNEANSTAINTSTLEIQNTPPETAIPTLSNYTPKTNDVISCLNSTTADLDDDAVTFSYKWFENNIRIPGQISNTLNLSTSGLNKADSVICEITPNDGEENGNPKNSSAATIQNTLPTKPNITSPQNNSVQNKNSVVIECGNSIDADNDSLTFSIFGDTSTNPITQLPVFGNQSTFSTIDGQNYFAKCLSSDDETNSTNSSIITFYEAHRPDIFVQNTSANLGKKKILNFTVNDSLWNMSVYWEIRKNNAVEQNFSNNSTANATISFNYTFTDIAVYSITITANNSYKTLSKTFEVNVTAGCGAIIENITSTNVVINSNTSCQNTDYYMRIKQNGVIVECTDELNATNLNISKGFIIEANNTNVKNCVLQNFNETLILNNSNYNTFENITITNSNSSLTAINATEITFNNSYVELKNNLDLDYNITLGKTTFAFANNSKINLTGSFKILNSDITGNNGSLTIENAYFKLFNSTIGFIGNNALLLQNSTAHLEDVALNNPIILNLSANSLIKDSVLVEVSLIESDDNTIENITLNNTGSYGIRLENSDNNNITKTNIENYEYGIILENSSYNFLDKLTLDNNYSILFNATINNTLQDAFFYTDNITSEITYDLQFYNRNFVINYTTNNGTNLSIGKIGSNYNDSEIIYKGWLTVNALIPTTIDVQVYNYALLNNITWDNINDTVISSKKFALTYLIQNFDNISDHITGQYVVKASADNYYTDTENPQVPPNAVLNFSLTPITSDPPPEDDPPTYGTGGSAPPITEDIVEPPAEEETTNFDDFEEETTPNVESPSDTESTRKVASRDFNTQNFRDFAEDIHTNRWHEYTDGSTKIFYSVKNTGIATYKRIAVIATIPKSIAENMTYLGGNFSVQEEDPVIFFLIYNLTTAESREFTFTILNKTLTEGEVKNITFDIKTEISKEELEELEKLARETQKVIGVTTIAVSFNNKTKITTTLSAENIAEDVTVYLEIPKCLAQTIKEIKFEMEDYEVIQDDPLIAFSFASVSGTQDIKFEVLKEVDPDCWEQIKALPIAQRIGDKILVNNEKKLYWVIGIILAINMLVLGFNFLQKKSRESSGKSFFHKVEFGIIETILIIIIVLNIMDFIKILTPDLDFAKKILSWAILGLLLYEINLEKIFYGRKKLLEMLILLFANFMLMARVFVDYVFIAYNDIVERHLQSNVIYLYQKIVDFELQNPGLITGAGFFIGFQILLVLALFDIFKDIKAPSLFAALHMEGRPQNLWQGIKRFFIALLIYLAFFIIFFNFFMEWLAISVDATIMVIGIIIYGIRYVVKHAHHYEEGHIISRIGNVGEAFYQQFIGFFKYRYTIMFGLAGILVLHLLVDVGNYIIPFLINVQDVLYFSQIGTIHLSLFAILKALYTPDILTNIVITTNYLLNTIFIILCLVFPAYLWYDISKNHTINITRPWLALFFIAITNYALQPLILIKSIDTGQVLGVDIIFNAASDASLAVSAFIISIAAGIVVYLISKGLKTRTMLKFIAAIFLQVFFFGYVFFYVKSWIFALLPQIKVLFAASGAAATFLSGLLSVFLVITVMFYVFAYLYFIHLVYAEWFIKKYTLFHLIDKYKEIIIKYRYNKEQQVMLIQIIKKINHLKTMGVSDLRIKEKLYEGGISEKLIDDIIYL